MRYKRRRRARVFNAISLLVVSIYAGNAWCYLGQLCLTAYYIFLIGYSYRKTRICPLEIIAGTAIGGWPRTFRRMYKERALKMQLLYFALMILIVLKGLYLCWELTLYLSSI